MEISVTAFKKEPYILGEHGTSRPIQKPRQRKTLGETAVCPD